MSTLALVRRLDGGRRELLEVEAPAVVSVEGSVATLRRDGIDVWLVTGDARPAAEAVARATGIEHVVAEVDLSRNARVRASLPALDHRILGRH